MSFIVPVPDLGDPLAPTDPVPATSPEIRDPPPEGTPD
jgi:hypothetical protein